MLVLHNLTPHFHAHAQHGENAIQKTKTSEETLGWLVGLFGMDMGEGHLQNFSVQKDASFDVRLESIDFQPFPIVPFVFEPLRFSQETATKPVISALNEFFLPDYRVSAFRLRGPPFLYC